jgi:hypothetical protein
LQKAQSRAREPTFLNDSRCAATTRRPPKVGS